MMTNPGETNNDLSAIDANSPLLSASSHNGSDAEPTRIAIAVIIASANRPNLLAEALQTCAGQVGVAYQGVVSVPDEDSLPKDRALLAGWQVVMGTRGAAVQRNAALNQLEGVDVVAFFDDDALPRTDYLATALAFFERHPEVVALTGRVLLDGAAKGEIPTAQAVDALAASAEEEPSGRWRRTRELYGCNLVVRAEIAVSERFDERLPLYSWLEDHDFARRCMRRGKLARVDDCVIVHRGAASGGRQAHRRLGYSQLMNPIYLFRKGSFPLWLAIWEIFRPVAKNLLYAVAGSSKRWRRERLDGNLTAAADAVRGRFTPERIVHL